MRFLWAASGAESRNTASWEAKKMSLSAKERLTSDCKYVQKSCYQSIVLTEKSDFCYTLLFDDGCYCKVVGFEVLRFEQSWRATLISVLLPASGVCCLEAARVPFVLWPLPRREDHIGLEYDLVGEAYLHGMMDKVERAVEDNADFTWETLVLV